MEIIYIPLAIFYTVIVKRGPIGNCSGKREKGEYMEPMTDKQMEVILNLLADKFAACKNMEDVQQAIKEVREMAKKEKPAE